MEMLDGLKKLMNNYSEEIKAVDMPICEDVTREVIHKVCVFLREHDINDVEALDLLHDCFDGVCIQRISGDKNV